MDIENMLNQLKEILPAENFKTQPAAAREELLQLESKYKINTSDFIKDKNSSTTIADEIRDKWINTLDTFINFNGSMSDLNHLPSHESSFYNKPFINNQASKENSAKEYIKKVSKESNWLPCLFLYLNHSINFQAFFWVKQESRIRT